nr:CBM_HP1_G0004180.mRNA.1.CDS.1 [Saccharomyces cerevisiae]
MTRNFPDARFNRQDSRWRSQAKNKIRDIRSHPLLKYQTIKDSKSTKDLPRENTIYPLADSNNHTSASIRMIQSYKTSWYLAW